MIKWLINRIFNNPRTSTLGLGAGTPGYLLLIEGIQTGDGWRITVGALGLVAFWAGLLLKDHPTTT